LEEAVRFGEAMGAGGDMAECHRNLALVQLALGEHQPALSSAARALELARSGAPLYLPQVIETAAEVCRQAPAALRARARALAEELAVAAEGDAAARCRELVATLQD